MKNVFALIAIALCLVITSCENETDKKTTPEVAEGYKIYDADSLGFSFTYPDIFEPRNYINPRIPLAFYESTKDSINYLFRANALFLIEDIPTQIEVPFGQYIQANKTQLQIMMQKNNPYFKVYESDSINIDNVPVGTYKFDTPKNDSTTFTSKMYIAMQHNRSVQINCTTLKEKFETYEPVFDQMISSLKFKKK